MARRQRQEVPARLYRRRKRIVDVLRHLDGRRRLFEVRARRGERDHLLVDAVFLQHAFAEVEIAMAGHEDVVVARIMQPRIALGVEVHADSRGAFLDRGKILGRVVMIVEVDFHECVSLAGAL
jgi:hypothetical protein